MSRVIAAGIGLVVCAAAADAQVVISQVYGGGGNAGATYTNDFIEVFNRGTTSVDLTGMSVQYASSAGATWQVTPLTAFMLAPGQYYLVQEAQGAGGSTPLPMPDATGTIAMSATNGKVALVSGTTALTGTCPTAGVVDFVGFGTANCSETTPTPALSNTTAAIRAMEGCTDSNNNFDDFTILAPNPRNTASPFHTCGGPMVPPSGIGMSDPPSQCPGFDVTLTVAVTLGTPPAPIVSVVGDLTAIGGPASVSFVDDGTNGDVTPNDGVYTAIGTIAPGTTTGSKSIPVTITDATPQIGTTSVSVTVNFCGISATGTSRGICNGETGVLTVHVTPAIMPPSTGIRVLVDFTPVDPSIGLVDFFDDGTHGDEVAGDNIFSYSFTVPNDAMPAATVLQGAVLDDQNRNNTFMFTLSHAPCTQTTTAVVISQVYGGGGNQGATLTNDYIELFNRSSAPVDIGGMSVQYGSGSTPGPFLFQTNIPAGTMIPAGGYYLIEESAQGGGTQPLPTPDLIGDPPIAMGATAGRVALVSDQTLIPDCAAPTIVDIIGYGSNVPCWDGVLPAPTSSNTLAEFRRDDGCFDSNNNGLDFFTGDPAPRNSGSPIHLCNPPPVCACDWNHDHILNSQDFFDFVTSFFAGSADFNNDNITNSQDFFDFLNCFFAGCP